MNLVDQRVGTGEAADALHSRAHYPPYQIFECRHSGKTPHFDVAETVQGEPGLPHFDAFPLQDVRIDLSGGVGAPQIVDIAPGIEASVVEQFGSVRQPYCRTLWPGQLQSAPTAEILAHIVDPDIPLRVQQGDRLDGLHYLDRGHDLDAQRAIGCLCQLRRMPVRIIVPGRRPAGLFKAGIVGLSVVVVIVGDRSGSDFPAIIAVQTHALTGAKLDIQLQQQARPVTVGFAMARRGWDVLLGAVPTVAQHSADGVFTHLQIVAHIMGGVQNTRSEFEWLVVVVIGLAGIQHLIAYLAAVDVEFAVTQAGGVDGGSLDFPGQGEFSAQQR